MSPTHTDTSTKLKLRQTGRYNKCNDILCYIKQKLCEPQTGALSFTLRKFNFFKRS